jgi:hypothetical protein
LLASVVRNCWSSAVVSVDALLDEALVEGLDVDEVPDASLDDTPRADNRFWKSEVSVLSALEVLLVVPESDDVPLEVEESDCARFEIADARSPP